MNEWLQKNGERLPSSTGDRLQHARSAIQNPVTHLASAVQKIGTWDLAMRLNETTRLYVETVTVTEG